MICPHPGCGRKLRLDEETLVYRCAMDGPIITEHDLKRMIGEPASNGSQ